MAHDIIFYNWVAVTDWINLGDIVFQFSRNSTLPFEIFPCNCKFWIRGGSGITGNFGRVRKIIVNASAYAGTIEFLTLEPNVFQEKFQGSQNYTIHQLTNQQPRREHSLFVCEEPTECLILTQACWGEGEALSKKGGGVCTQPVSRSFRPRWEIREKDLQEQNTRQCADVQGPGRGRWSL